jgi:peptidoglycan/LPS O-acetylase OafA/YrhL
VPSKADEESSQAVEISRPLITTPLRHVPAFDGMRGVALLFVLAAHFRFSWSFNYRPATVIDHIFTNMISAGWIAVDVYFVLSGFLITCILLDVKRTEQAARNFYVRRFLRLFPPYYLALFVLFIVVPAVGLAPPALQTLSSYQGWYWAYGVNIFVVWFAKGVDLFQTIYLWSLSVEEHFYILWPWFVLRASQRTVQRVCVAAIAIAIGLRLCITLMGWSWMAAYYMMPTRMDAIAVGALMATLARDEAGSALLRRAWRPALAIGAAIIFLIIATHFHYDFDDPIVVVVGYFANAMVSGAIIVGVLEGRFGIFRWTWLQKAGVVSYGAYVYHRLVWQVAKPWGEVLSQQRWFGFDLPAQLVWMVGLMLVSLAIAGLSYRWIEAPCLRLKDRLAPRKSAAVSTVPSTSVT